MHKQLQKPQTQQQTQSLHQLKQRQQIQQLKQSHQQHQVQQMNQTRDKHGRDSVGLPAMADWSNVGMPVVQPNAPIVSPPAPPFAYNPFPP